MFTEPARPTRLTLLVAAALAGVLAPLADRPVFTQGMFDSQNVAFWSPGERR